MSHSAPSPGIGAIVATALGLLLTGAAFEPAHAEPWFAVREGLKCGSCHVDPSGGGLRNAFGNTWAQTVLPARRIEVPEGEQWTGRLHRNVAVGGNLRTGVEFSDVPGTASRREFDVEELRLYLDLAAIPERLGLYLDQRVAPGGSTNLEAYARYTSGDGRWHLKAGQFFLPFGLRLEDDTAFTRQVTGINFATPDKGVQLGLDSGELTAQLAVTNGTAAGPETDEGKQFSARAAWVRPAWRIGASYNLNDADAGERRMQGLFAGLRTGPIAWLAEADYIIDEGFAPRRRLWVGLLEGNWSIAPGHNLKLTAEYFEPDTDVDEDEQNRYSAVWEFVPFQFLQIRAGARYYDGIPQNDLQNRRLWFVGLNGFF